MTWKPHVTVAAIAERDGKFLVVEEQVHGRLVINNPAGHLDEEESLTNAVVRETLEETGWEFEPEAIVGIYLWKAPRNDKTFLRVAFCGRCHAHHAERRLDDGIMRALWLSREELAAAAASLRSPLVLRSIDEYRTGIRHTLDVLTYLTGADSPAA
jgi:ADP-ribose pyrophosphatase YjhB (NUDIX family)